MTPKETIGRPAVGHLVNHRDGPRGTPGAGYDYLMAGNGVFVQAESGLLQARILLAEADVRGLAPAEARLELANGPIPMKILRAGVTWFRENPDIERYFAIGWEGQRYRAHVPQQDGRQTGMTYEPLEGMVAEFHSHGRMRAFFSGADDQDEQGFRIYGVLGNLDQPTAQIAVRIGIYGHFQELNLREVIEHNRGTG